MKSLNIQDKIGDINYNTNGEKMEVIAVSSYGDITIQFEDGTIKEHVSYARFKDGMVKNYMSPSVLGIGITGNEKVRINGVHTKEYRTWRRMLIRCYANEDNESLKTYKDCSVCEEWKYFPNFKQWCHSQDNWNKVMENPKEFQLDKDIIKKGNRIYCPDYCSFVPQNINELFNIKRNRGDLPVGVTRCRNKYRAVRNNRFKEIKSEHYVVDSIEEAFDIYKKEKEKVIKYAAQLEYEKGNITRKCYEAMLNYNIEIND